MAKFLLILLLVLVGLYFHQCYRNVSTDYFKYLKKTFLPYALVVFLGPVVLNALLSSDLDTMIGTSIFSAAATLLLFGFNTIAYLVSKEIRKADLKREAHEAEEMRERQRRKKEDASLENDDMRSMKQLMAEIDQRAKSLKAFNDEISTKIADLEVLGNKTIGEAYGDIAIGVPKDKYYALYDKIHERFAPSADAMVSLHCDRIVKKIAGAIGDRRQIIDSNNRDIGKLQSMKSSLQRQYDKEYKLQRMKSIDAKVNEMTDATSEIAAALSSGSLLEATREEFDRLNLEIETRRELEVKYSTIDI